MAHLRAEIARLSARLAASGILMASSAQLPPNVLLQQIGDALQFYALLADNSPDPMMVVDRQCVFHVANAAYARWNNAAREDIIGKQANVLLGEETFNAMIGPMLARAFAGEWVHYEKWFEFPNQVQRYLEVRYFPLRTDGEINYVAVLLHDITERQQAAEALRESEDRFRAFSEAATEGIIIHEYGRIIGFNPAIVEHFGYTPDELYHMSVTDLTAPESRPEIIRHMQADDPGPYEAMSLHKNGTSTIGEIRARNVTYQGRPVRVVAIRDITELKQVQESLRQLLRASETRAAEMDATLSAIADGFVIYGPHAEILRMNATAEQLLRFPPGLKERPFTERTFLYRLEDAEGHPMPLEQTPSYRALHGETVRGVVMAFCRLDQRRIWVSVSAAPIRTPTGEILGAVVTFSDITAMRDLQERQKDLLHLVSHDLRVPLTVIHGHMQMMEQELRQHAIDGAIAQSVAAIDRATQRMNTMIRDLVDMARLESGQLHLNLTAIGLADFLRDLLVRLEGTLETGRLHLDMPEALPPVCADDDRLERIVVNLLTNALKYSADGTPVVIRAWQSDAGVSVAVSDQGCGIAPEELPHLFERFYRARHKGMRVAEGLGLGLYITRMLVEAHHGRIWVTSDPGKGSTFYFSLPVASA